MLGIEPRAPKVQSHALSTRHAACPLCNVTASPLDGDQTPFTEATEQLLYLVLIVECISLHQLGSAYRMIIQSHVSNTSYFRERC